MRGLLRSQTIISAREEVEKSAISQILKLLTYLRFDVLVARIQVAQVSLETIDLFKRELALAECLHAFHDIKQPATVFRRFISEKKRLLPFSKNVLFLANETVLHNMNLAGLRDPVEEYIGADPACASCGYGQRL